MGFNVGGDFWGKKKVSDREINYWLPWQHQLGKNLGDYLLGGFGSNWMQQYAQPTQYEKMGMGMLGNWLSGTPESWTNAQGAVNRAMTGKGYEDIIDPKRTEELYGSIEHRTMKDILPKVLRGASNVANIGGMLRSGAGGKLQLEQMGEITNQLAQRMAELKYQDELQRRGIAREREARQLQAVPMGMQVGELPLRQIQAALGYGGYPRQLMGMQYNNPMMQALMQALKLQGKTRGRETGTEIGTKQYGGFSWPW